MSGPAATGNFLTRLAGQAHGVAPVLSPRLPALFEPVSQAPAPVADGAPPAPRRLLSQALSGDANAPRQPGDGDGLETPARDAPLGRHTRQMGLDAASDAGASARATVPVAAKAPATPRRSAPSATVAPARIAVSAAVDHAPLVHDDAASATRPQESRLDRAMAEGMRVPDRSLARTMCTQPATAISSVAPAPGLPDRIPPSIAVDAGTRRAPGDSHHATEPVIRVSIGRIEVRAVAAPATTAQQPARPRPTGLDDYLQQRGRTR